VHTTLLGGFWCFNDLFPHNQWWLWKPYLFCMKRGTSMFVTTAGRTTDNLIEEAHRIANELSVSFIPRRKRSIEKLQSEYGEDFLVVGNQRLEL
jgi:hypothetical protein